MRRLPVYLLLDTSGSMMGEPIEAVRNGVDLLHATLIQDPYALETAYLSVITFDSEANQLTPLTELAEFQVPQLKVKGTTSFGNALSLAADCIEREVQKSTADTKGDWKPLVFIMTDGAPTDDWQKGLDRFRQVKCGNIIACAAGPHADTKILKQVAEVVVHLETADTAAIKVFFEWVSGSIANTSKKIDLTKSDADGPHDLPPPPKEISLVK
ncbi:von Willebrand factor type A domain protein [Pseudovibrio sp. W64]|uniref:vWA domain-containing protein n=1 Tax=Pseudovibrio sp. W64 TaxID=1735583 RepID=UPI0007AED961|nr:VWA domain-containing protein [Pseudovibrio sp. W64]KZK79086.1 von Willebrand factor type A domain protein [Pseudovibrio sp. W64]